jgi:4-amino-4-deoxy-L-arabinose transferase-like glycosyltransferase
VRRLATFPGGLAAIALGALAVRLAYVAVRRGAVVQGDALTFVLTAANLAAGEGFRRPYEDAPTAEHPPLHVVLLAAIQLAGLDSHTGQRVVLALLGTATVVVLGLVGRRVAGPRAGLLAAGIAALYPNLWVIDAALMSETPYLLLVALVLLAALAARDTPAPATFAVLGAAIGLAALTRGEALGLLPALAAPLAWASGGPLRRRLGLAAAAAAAFGLVLAPWTARNLATFEEPVLISNNASGLWAGANCPRTYGGELIGSWVFSCYPDVPAQDESTQFAAYREAGLTYLREHASRLPVVLAARLGRGLDVFRVDQSLFFNASEGRGARATRWGIRAWWVLAPLALAGLVVLRRRGGPAWVLAAPMALALAVVLVVYGSTRLRVVAEPAVVVAAGVAVDAALRWRAGRRAGTPGSPRPGPRAARPG